MKKNSGSDNNILLGQLLKDIEVLNKSEQGTEIYEKLKVLYIDFNKLLGKGPIFPVQ